IAVSGRAVAQGRYSPSTPNVLVLDPSGTSVTATGGAGLNVTNGGLFVNSTSTNALNISNNTSVTANEYDFSGPSVSNTASLQGPSGGSATIYYNQTATPDPLQGLPAPSTSGFTKYDSN